MKIRNALLSVTILTLGAGTTVWATQEGDQDGDDMGSMMVQPGPEVELIQSFVGTWDHQFTFSMPGMPPATTQAVEIVTSGPGGLSTLHDYKDPSFMGMGYAGHGVMWWDAEEQVYCNAWIDSMAGKLEVMKGTWNAETKTLTFKKQGMDWTTGEPAEEVHTTKVNDDGTMLSIMSSNGKEMARMEGKKR
jgi:hypothetical protein